jgi:hypothetical protein
VSSGGFWSLAEAAIKFEAFSKNMKYASEAILVEWCVTVQKRAKESLGSYHRGWPKLAESTVERKGGRDTPLLDTGELRDSISGYVEMYSSNSGRGVVGTPLEKGLWAEIGTSRGEPPRPWLMPAALHSKSDIDKIARKYIRSAWVSAGRDNEILHLLHAIKMLLEVAHEIISVTKHVMKKQ